MNYSLLHETKETTGEATGVREIECPSCSSAALYKYGKAWTGKQRFLCMLCGKQFTEHPRRATVKDRPVCPECGKPMNLYKIEGSIVRFRCSGYPACRTFKKYRMKEEEHELLHP